MPDIPDAAIEAAATARLRLHCAKHPAGRLTWQDFAGEARVMLDAAAQPLGEHCASKILAHAGNGGPRPGPGSGAQSRNRAWRRYFNIAARVAARAFLDDDDMLGLAGQALAKGDYVACGDREDGAL